jgi:hypothetical protein
MFDGSFDHYCLWDLLHRRRNHIQSNYFIVKHHYELGWIPVSSKAIKIMQRFLSRIAAQKFQNLGTAALTQPPTKREANFVKAEEEKPVTAEDNEQPLSASEIEFYLNKFDKTMDSPADTLVFDSIQSAAGWYEINKPAFQPRQQAAMETLVTARNQVNMGCSCKKHVRQRMADDYLKTFILNNQQTDLLPSIKLAAKVQKVIVKIADQVFFQG